jgi:hypothetical protein
VSRLVIGIALGFLSGILIYALVAGGLVSGDAFPNMEVGEEDATSHAGKNVALAIVWSVAAGYSFEAIFDRVRLSSPNGR